MKKHQVESAPVKKEKELPNVSKKYPVIGHMQNLLSEME